MARWCSLKTIILLSTLILCVNSWKKCQETFCERARKSPTGYEERYFIDKNSIVIKDGTFTAKLNTKTPSTPTLNLVLSAFEDFTFKVLINELNPASERYQVQDALLEEKNRPKIVTLKQHNKTDDYTIMSSDKLSAKILYNAFKIELYREGRLISTINPEDRFLFETAADKSAIALGLSFANTQRAYGIPEHADHLSLRNTRHDNNDPYRLYNLDYGHYALESTESLYGAVPVLYAHGTEQSSGVFWLNAAQTWIDILTSPNDIDAFFMSESGVLEMYVLTGPTLRECVQQYTDLTGTAPLPQLFTLGYHQSRYSYMTQDDVLKVVDNFNANNLSLDVMWLDIDYTDQKKYFTWDPIRFKNPKDLQTALTKENKKLVAIIDPHIKVDNGYFLYKEASSKGYFVKQENSNDFQGECWPGKSSYLDFLNPKALDYYASLYTSNNFEHKNVHVWNDMNEPAIFNDAANENTMSGELMHNGKWKHRDVHNIYGFYQTIGTKKGMLARPNKVRPFILTRSHFAGIQRYAAIWTGDNHATWEYLQISFPMCLTEALAGVSFCGADVGGFGGIPSDELYQRWYQAGAWLPFYRGHSAIDVPRREPYLYSTTIQDRIRTAIQQRYTHLPAWYTQFFEHERTGEPVIRPITYQYPKESDAMDIEDQVLVGKNILAAPVLKSQSTIRRVYLPGGKSEVWYNIDNNYKAYNGTGYHLFNVTLDSIPVFYRGGSIIPTKETPRLSTGESHKDPFTIYVSLNYENKAEGSLYVDDYETFDYQNKKYLYLQLTYADNAFSSKKIDENANYELTANLDKVVILNPPKKVKKVSIEGSEKVIEMSYNDDKTILNINALAIDLQKPFTIKLIGSSAQHVKISMFALISMLICFVLV